MKPSRAQAHEIIELLYGLDWAEAYLGGDRYEITVADMTPADAHDRLDQWLDERGVDEGVQIVPDEINGAFGTLDCVTVRIGIAEVVQ